MGVEILDTRVLFPVEWSDDRAGCSGFAAQVEWNFRIVEPEAQVELVGCTKGYCGAAWRDGERFFVEDAAYAHSPCASAICLQVTLIPRDTERLVRELDHEEVVAGAGSQSAYTDFHQIIQRARS